MALPLSDTLTLPVLLAWLRAKLLKMIVGGIVCAVIAIPLFMTMPDTYNSSATVMVMPPAFKETGKTAISHEPEVQPDSISDMMSKTFPIEVYKELALSSPVLDKVIRTVPLKDTSIRSLRDSLEVGLVQVGSRALQTPNPYGQVMMFNAKAETPEKAAKVAQTWAETFKDTVDSATSKRIEDTFGLLDTLHTDTKTNLEQADRALADHKKQWNLKLMKAEMKAKGKQLTRFDRDLKQAEVDLASKESKLKTIEEELAKEPQKEVYFRAPSDDAYWNAEIQGAGAKMQPDKGLRTEEPNKSYLTIRKAEVKEKAKVEGLKSERDTLTAKIDGLRSEIQALSEVYADKSAERDALERESDSLGVSYETVRAQFEKARMAERTMSSDIVIAGNAVAPYRPVGPGKLQVALSAGLVGMILMAGFLLFKELSEAVPPSRRGRLLE